MRRLLLAISWGLLAAYPVIVYLGLRTAGLNWLGGFLILLGLLRLFLLRKRGHDSLVSSLLVLLLLLAGAHALLTESATGLLYYPVTVNALLLFFFAFSLGQDQTIVERIARQREEHLPPTAVAYTRRVTIAWCAFFLVNGAIALYTALWASLQAWTLYNGFIAYLLIGLLFGVEWLIRQKIRHSAHD